MKFVHIADMHFDVPFTYLNSQTSLGEVRRLEQRNIFRKAIDYIEKNHVDFLFISGDLYEHEYVKRSTIEFIAKEFSRIPNTKIFIAPGNHDPYIKNSYYETFDFGNNVHIFKKDVVEKVEAGNINVYGMAFNEFYMEETPLDKIEKLNHGRINILVAHCDLNGAKDREGLSYNPITETKLKSLKFDYCAIGHIHKRKMEKDSTICYPGSPIALGFDEIGSHGMIVGEIGTELRLEYVELDERQFVEVEVSVEDVSSNEELIEKLSSINLVEKNLYKVVLMGRRSFEIDLPGIMKVLDVINILKIKDNTRTNYDIQDLRMQNNLKGFFVNELYKMYQDGKCTEEQLQKAIEIGFEAM